MTSLNAILFKARDVRIKGLLVVLLFLFPVNMIKAQISLGAGVNFLIPGKNLFYGFGLNLQGEYDFHENYAIRLNSGFSFSEFNKIKYFASDPYTLAGFEGAVLFYPFVEPKNRFFCGLGIGYYLPSTSIGGMPHALTGDFGTDRHMVTSNHLDNALGFNIIGGMKFNAGKRFSVNMELKYTYMKTDWTSEITAAFSSYHEIFHDKIDLSRLTGTLSFNFKL